MSKADQEIKIEKGIPLPRINPFRKYPIQEMKVGDSFFIPEINPSTTSSVHIAAKRHGFKVVTRRQGAGVRVWRVA